jgi:hypothetical protein
MELKPNQAAIILEANDEGEIYAPGSDQANHLNIFALYLENMRFYCLECPFNY